MERLKLINLFNLEKRRLLTDLTLCFKINGFVNSSLQHSLLARDYTSMTWHNFKFRCSKFSTNSVKYSFCNRTVRPWNALLIEIVNKSAFSRFNALIHDFDINSYLGLHFIIKLTLSFGRLIFFFLFVTCTNLFQWSKESFSLQISIIR